MPAPVNFAPTATRALPNSAPGGAVGQYTGQYGTNYPRITVQEPLRSNDNSRQLGFPERGIGYTTPRYEAPQRPIEYTEIPIERGLPVWRGGQGTQPPQSQGGQTYAPSSPSGSSGGARFIPIGFPQSPAPFGSSEAAGFDTRADYEAWKQGASREQLNREREANNHFERYGDSLGGPRNYTMPGGGRTDQDFERLTDDANRYRQRNGLGPVSPDGSRGVSPSGLGDGLRGLGDGLRGLGDGLRGLGGLFPTGNAETAGDPYGIPNPLDTSDRNPRPSFDPFAPLAPDLPGNPFTPGSPGGSVDPGSAPVNPEGRGTWFLQTYNRGQKQWTWSYPNRLPSDVPQQTSPGPGWIKATFADGSSAGEWGDVNTKFESPSFQYTFTPDPSSPGRPPSVFSFPPRPGRVGSPVQPAPYAGNSPASGSSPGSSAGSVAGGAPAPSPTPYNPLQPAPAPSPSPAPSPFLPPLPLPLPVPGRSPAPTGTTPLRSPNPSNAPRPIGSPSPSPSPSPNPGSGSGSGSNSPPQPSPCSYKEDETQAETVDYFTVTPIGRVKTPKTIQVHEKMAEATKLQFEVLGQMRESLDKIEKNTKISKVMHMVSMATTIHNAIMLSRDLAETLGNVTSMTFTAVGRMTGVVGESDFVNVNEILGSQFNEFMERTLGRELWSGTKESWLKASRIYQSGANIVNSVRDIADSTRDIGEFTAQNVSKIGNALKKYRVVGWDAYPTMDEEARAKSKFFRNFDRAIEKGERLENAASSLGGVSGNVLSIQDEVREIKENRDAFQRGIAEWGRKDETKQRTSENASKVDESLEEKDLK